MVRERPLPIMELMASDDVASVITSQSKPEVSAASWSKMPWTWPSVVTLLSACR